MAAANLKAQDVLVALKLAAHPEQGWQQKDVATSLGVSQAEVSHGLKRLARCRLYNAPARRVSRAALFEFLAHGIRYVFPAEEGAPTRGSPTAWSAPPLRDQILSSTNIVWPDQDGEVEGRSLAPLHKNVPMAAKQDARMYELLALVDTLRAGRAREREVATRELQKRLQ